MSSTGCQGPPRWLCKDHPADNLRDPPKGANLSSVTRRYAPLRARVLLIISSSHGRRLPLRATLAVSIASSHRLGSWLPGSTAWAGGALPHCVDVLIGLAVSRPCWGLKRARHARPLRETFMVTIFDVLAFPSASVELRQSQRC